MLRTSILGLFSRTETSRSARLARPPRIAMGEINAVRALASGPATPCSRLSLLPGLFRHPVVGGTEQAGRFSGSAPRSRIQMHDRRKVSK